MDSCIHKEFQNKEIGGDQLKVSRYECHDCEQSRDDRLEDNLVDRHIDDKIRNNALLRTSDSDADECDSVGDPEAKTNQKDADQSKKVTKHSESIVVNSVSDSVGDPASDTRDTKIWRSRRFSAKNNNNNQNPKKMSIKWGEAVGIYDDKGRPKRVVDLSEVKNYIRLKQQPRSQFQFYFSLVHPRFPQLYKCFNESKQRWRMRYNIFVSGLLPEKNKSMVHVGEIIIYFDVARHLSHPFYTNCSFYPNYQPLEREVDNSLLTKMIVRLHDVLTSNLMLQLKFPIDEDDFKNITNLFNRFRSNEAELMQELEIIRGGNKTKFSPGNHNWLSIAGNNNRGRNHRQSASADDEFSARGNGRRNRGDGRTQKENRYFDVQRGSTRNERRAADRRRDRQSNKNKDQSHGGYVMRESVADIKRSNDRNQTKNLSKQTTQKRNRNNERFDGNDSEFGAVNPFRNGRTGERQSRPKTRFR